MPCRCRQAVPRKALPSARPAVTSRCRHRSRLAEAPTPSNSRGQRRGSQATRCPHHGEKFPGKESGADRCDPRVFQRAERGREARRSTAKRSEEHTSELQSPCNLVCRLLLEKKKKDRHTAAAGCGIRR